MAGEVHDKANDKVSSDASSSRGCTRCGAEVPSDVRFCPECGSPQRTAGSRATVGPRYAAFLVDLTMVVALWVVVSVVAQPLSGLLGRPPRPSDALGLPSGLVESQGSLLGAVLIPLTAFFYFWVSGARGQSVGQRILGLKVRRLEGSAPGPLRGMIRSAIVWAPLSMMLMGRLLAVYPRPGAALALLVVGTPLFLILLASDLVLVLFSRSKRALHDLAAGTEVVHI